MKNLALHILDIVQNSIAAEATLIEISIDIQDKHDLLSIEIKDNGRGMTKDVLAQVRDPFFTSRTTRKIGMGIPLFEHSANQCNGSLQIESAPGEGSTISARFSLNHIDLPPLGDLAGVVLLLMQSNTGTEFILKTSTSAGESLFDSREIKEILGDIPLNEPRIRTYIKNMLTAQQSEVEALTISQKI